MSLWDARGTRGDRGNRGSRPGTSSGRRARAAVVLVPLLLASTGCAGLGAGDPDVTEICLLAEAVGTASSEDPEAVSRATIALAEALPEGLQDAALLLAQPSQAAEETATDGGAIDAGDATIDAGSAAADGADLAAEQSERLRALAGLQGWAMETCGIYLTIGAPVDAGLEASDARLADFETVTGEDAAGVYISVLGVSREDVALILCEQALAEYAGGDGENFGAAAAEPGVGSAGGADGAASTEADESQVQVQVLDPVGRTIAHSDGGECLAARG